jgi:TolA-binding protein
MRSILGCILALGLAVSPAVAGTGEAGSNPAPAPSPASAAKSDPTPAPAKADAKTDSASLESEIEELRSLLESQSSQLQQQNDQLKQQQEKMEALEEQLKTTNASHANAALAPATAPVLSVSPATPASAQPTTAATSPMVLAATTPASAVAASPADPQDQASPLQIHIGNATIIPIGFMDFTGEFRNHNAGGGIGTSFASIPYPFTAAPAGGLSAINLAYHNTEARLSMQNSRIGFRVDGVWKGAHFIGYMEADFLGNNAASVAVGSNSNTLRSRLYWVDVSKGKWEILGGQTWSLITPGRSGISPLPGNIFYSQNIDVNYQAGLVWGRIPELRFVYHPSSKAAFAVALDNQEQYDGGANGAPSVVLPTGADVVNGVSTLVTAGQLNAGSTTVNAPQVFPDVIVKLALDPSAKFHIEAGGVERQERVSVNSTTASTSPVLHQSATAGGIFVNLNVQLFPGFRLLTNNFWSEGGGRYIFAEIPDVVVHPNGSLTDIQAASTVTGFEWTHKNTLIYFYYGGIYAAKTVFTDATLGGNTYGYGVPVATSYTTAISQNRSIQEATFGFNQTLWKDAKYGAINFMGQYSYLTRDPWAFSPGQPDHAGLNMAFLNLRYTLPGSAPAVGDLK